MFAGLFLMVAIGSSLPASPADTLVARLGSPRFAEREEASESLIKLGRAALPALRTAQGDRDLEVRTRARALVERIEGEMLLQPTMVTLNFQDQPAEEIVRQLKEQTGLGVVLDPSASRALWQRRYSLVESEPVSFWNAIDRLGRATTLQATTSSGASPDRNQTSVLLYAASRRAAPPTMIHGPFRVRVVGLSYARDMAYLDQPVLSLPDAPVDPEQARKQQDEGQTPLTSEQFSVRFAVQGEPRLALSQAGPVVLSEARDDLGQSLLAGSTTGATIESVSFLELNASGTLPFQASLKRPSQPGKRIQVLKGTLPVHVQARKGDPVRASLTTGFGKLNRKNEASLTVHSVSPLLKTRQVTVVLSLVAQSQPHSAELDQAGTRVEADAFPFEVVDAEGRIIPWYLSGTSVVGNESRMTLVTLPSTTAGAPDELRFYGTIRKATVIPFEFRDLPMP